MYKMLYNLNIRLYNLLSNTQNNTLRRKKMELINKKSIFELDKIRPLHEVRKMVDEEMYKLGESASDEFVTLWTMAQNAIEEDDDEEKYWNFYYELATLMKIINA